MTRSPRRVELDRFKAEINFCAYASSRGFAVDRKKSSRRSLVLRHANGDKLIVSRGSNQHWKYFNVHDPRDQGTIIDFVQIRDRCSLGEVRKTLRPWVCKLTTATTTDASFIDLAPTEYDIASVVSAWENAEPVSSTHRYLNFERKIPRQLTEHPIFADQIRVDQRGNLLFAHRNPSLCGYEVKNRSFTGFAPGGQKAIFSSKPRPEDAELVIAESALDAMSYAALFGIVKKRFLSTAGQIRPDQLSPILAAASQLPDQGRVVLAVDHDAGGHQLADSIRAALTPRGLNVVTHHPEQQGEDWNDVLKRSTLRPHAALAFG